MIVLRTKYYFTPGKTIKGFGKSLGRRLKTEGLDLLSGLGMTTAKGDRDLASVYVNKLRTKVTSPKKREELFKHVQELNKGSKKGKFNKKAAEVFDILQNEYYGIKTI